VLGCLLVARFPLACEVADHPDLAGRALAVAGVDGSVLAASAQAELSGVRPGQKLREAIGRCPVLSVLEERPARYRAWWEEVLRGLEPVAFTIEAATEGVAYVALDDLEIYYGSLESALRAVVASAPPELGPRLGAAPTRFSAMLAARRAAAGGTSVVGEKELAGFLTTQTTEALPVSVEMVRRLRLLGLETLAQLRALPRSKLAAQFGSEGARAWELAHGREPAPLRPEPRRTPLAERLQLESPLIGRQAILAAWEQTLSRLLRQPVTRGLAARQVELRAATETDGEWSRTVTFKEARSDLRHMWSALRPVIEEARFPGPLSELGVELRGLVMESGRQLHLSATRPRMQEQLEESLRELKARYGYCPIGRIVELEPWSRIPERRLALIDFDP
jgi:DNA polymerase-4/protein ImuB